MRIRNSLALAAAAATLLAAPSLAAPLPSGSALVPVPSAAEPVSGTVLDTLASPFAVPGSFAGTLTTTVIQGDTSNPFGGLTFVYEFNNTSGPNSIGRLSIDRYLGVLADVSFDSGSTGVAPALADRNPYGDVIGFSFFPLAQVLDPLGETGFLTPGSHTRRLVVQTNAPDYRDAVGSLIDGGVTQAATFAPVPEPATAALALAACGLLVAIRRRV